MGAITIHAIGDFGWFSQRKTAPSYSSVFSALKAHYRYIKSKASAIWNDNFRALLSKAKKEVAKRWDSRIALKFWVAVPKDWGEKEALKRVVAFVSEQLNLPLENISAYFHPHPKNPHIHLLIYPRDKRGRKLEITPSKLKAFHKAWDLYLMELGYEIKRYKEESFSVPIWLLKKDEEIFREYVEFKKLREEIRRELEELKYEAEEISDEEISKKESFLNRLKDTFFAFKNKPFKEKQKELARNHLRALGFSESDKVAILLVKSGERPKQKILKADKIYNSDEFLRYLAYMNSQGYNIYVAVNKLKPTAKSRKKEDFLEKQRLIYLDIDGDKLGLNGWEYLNRIIKQENLPNPTLVIKTSRDNYQVYWLLDSEVEANKLELVIGALAKKYGLDQVQDRSRVFRLAGFFNRKEGKGNLVVPVYFSAEVCSFKAFEKFLPKLAEKIENKAKNMKTGGNLVSNNGLSLLLARYIDKLKQILPKYHFDPYSIQDFFMLIKAFHRDWQKGEYVIKSPSELEFVIADNLFISVIDGLEVEDYKKVEILAKVLEDLVRAERPEKLKRSPNYAFITALKIIYGKSFAEAEKIYKHQKMEAERRLEQEQAPKTWAEHDFKQNLTPEEEEGFGNSPSL